MSKGFFSDFFGFIAYLLSGNSEQDAEVVTPDNSEDSVSNINDINEGGKMSNKKILSVGINNYPGTSNDLKGCCADARNWSSLLKDQYGFHINAILLDKRATKKNVIKALKELIEKSSKGDVLVFTYSGHGSSIRDKNGDEGDKKDEVLCLYDNTYLTDDEIRNIVSKLPKGAKLTIISDSCFSGTISRAFLSTTNDEEYVKARYLPPEDDMEASISLVTRGARPFAYPEESMNHILLSGTDDKSYSYDAKINGKPCGAFSHYAIDILKKNPKITYNDFYKKLRKILPSRSYPQKPQLEGSKKNKDAIMFN